jgi:hypothetical protein
MAIIDYCANFVCICWSADKSNNNNNHGVLGPQFSFTWPGTLGSQRAKY